MTNERTDLRNIAIIAHVDHGKTTLVDQLLKQSGIFRSNEHVDERAMDSNELERERGITILAKNTAIEYNDTKINILDTPGHADFGGEVERILRMVDGVILVVDAFEGCMPQTRFVLKKALETNLKPIVVVNKIDRDFARPEEVVDEVLELFIELDANDEQLEFPVVFASGFNGTASLSPDPATQEDTLRVLYESILENIPSPIDNRDEPLQFQVSLLDYNDYVGRIGIGRIFRGTMKVGEQVAVLKRDGSVKTLRVTKLYGFLGLKRVEVEEAYAGDLVAVSGMGDIDVGETVCPTDHQEALPALHIDEPTLQMRFLVNNSPFAGREGKWVTSRKIQERLDQQLETDVSLRVDQTDSPDEWIVSGRGELHLSILIENMRREGFELQVSKPQVIIREIDGKRSEPYERVQIDVPEEHTGSIIESIGERKGEMLDMINNGNGQVRLIFLVPARGLIGYTTDFLTLTRGYGILNHTFDSYKPVTTGKIGGRRHGVLVSMENGTVTGYGVMQLEDRGTMFVASGAEIYAGQVVGESNRDSDLTINLTKIKHATNVRSASKDQTVTTKKPRIMSLEEALQYIGDDEYCEVTPESIRIRKKVLDKNERERVNKKKKLGE
ncbi:translational GTPase TypA [Sporosarcina sp. P21c]|uniref:translational GTPase TypA n=1 Tax=Sporosarcina TaxID=1569 RepID=UPI000A1657B4|nr:MULTISPECIES: translational GTPase TypA [Sporosarcina]ARJ39918.1 GTP-binding protein TypA [Sporosarcina ureae]PIC66514.1 translational GTPase TypA [Sporosarcina sp. P16a]PIC84343.1 translational GTPase TypA [Sporosarcina sp. P1]PIC89994.1 translational GTPase TypA [Sporosarcina sp. P21c]PIC93188.1 translational GTPase TypA [Sporosarcina sp. P25]